MMDTPRFHAGMKAFRQLDPCAADAFVAGLQDIAPDMVRAVVEFAFAEVMSRDVLQLQTRELMTIAMLAALGNAEPQLTMHTRAALRAGASRQEVLEVILQVAVYAGFPAAINALKCAKVVFESSGQSEEQDFWSEKA
jgi:4-carboxymuconolactone decarboxylase